MNNGAKSVETQLQITLGLDNAQLRSLELSNLKKLLPLYKNRCKEVKKNLKLLENESKKQKLKINGLEVCKYELETSIIRFKTITMDLSARESKVLQELKQAKVMYPIYQFKMNKFLEKFNSADKLKKHSVPMHWNQKFDHLLEQKQKLQQSIDVNEKLIQKFVANYLL